MEVWVHKKNNWMKEKLKLIRANTKYCSFLSGVWSSGEKHFSSSVACGTRDLSLDLVPLHNSPLWISPVGFRF